MIQQITIRQQILAALQRVYDGMAFDEPLSVDRIERELLAEFSPMAYALTPNPDFNFDALELTVPAIRTAIGEADNGAFLCRSIRHLQD